MFINASVGLNGCTCIHNFSNLSIRSLCKKNMKGLLVCVGLLVLFKIDLSLSSCKNGQSVKDKMKDVFIKGLCGSKNIAEYFSLNADVSWDGVQVFVSITVFKTVSIEENLSL